ncbi:MAG: hypothetical protein R3C02_02410 [Planctomycetaceae bacterium]
MRKPNGSSHSPETGDPSDPDVDVTFMYDEIAVESSKTYHQIKLVFSNGTSQTFDDNDSSGTYAGTGSHSGKEIDTVWVMFCWRRRNSQRRRCQSL